MLDIAFGIVQLAAAAILFLNAFWLPKELFLFLAMILSVSATTKLVAAILERLED